MIYARANERQTEYYAGQALAWLDTKTRWASSKPSALSAVAEYIANQDGLTLYD